MLLPVLAGIRCMFRALQLKQTSLLIIKGKMELFCNSSDAELTFFLRLGIPRPI